MSRRTVARAVAALGLGVLVAASGCRRRPAEPPVQGAPPAGSPPVAPVAPPVPSVAPPANPTAVPSAEEFQRRETEWARALANKDSVALDRLLAPEFLITGVGSTVSDAVGGRAEWLESVEKYPWPMHEVEDVRLAVDGDTVVVKCVWSGVYPPQSLTPEGGVLRFLITDVWVRQGQDWVVLARHSSLPRPEPQ